MCALPGAPSKSAGRMTSGAEITLATTYSRGGYTTTTIGKAAFDGRVRDGNGSDHSFMTTKKMVNSPVLGHTIAQSLFQVRLSKNKLTLQLFTENCTH